MRRVLTVAACAASMLLMGGVGAAQASDPDPAVPPAFSPPTATPVTDVTSAEAFARRYAARNAARFLGVNRSRVRVVDANSACLEHPIIAARFGCVITLRALVIQRRHNWRNWEGASAASKSSTPRRRVRIRTFGCLGLLRIVGGPSVTPSVTVPLIECARAPRGDYTAPEPVV